jgi:hypothetical protein
MSATNTELEGISAELASIVRTADLIAHEGLQPDSDGPRVLAGLISQLGTQLLRVVEPGSEDPRQTISDNQSPNEEDAPTEEDVSPEDAPAEPPRDV